MKNNRTQEKNSFLNTLLDSCKGFYYSMKFFAGFTWYLSRLSYSMTVKQVEKPVKWIKSSYVNYKHRKRIENYQMDIGELQDADRT